MQGGLLAYACRQKPWATTPLQRSRLTFLVYLNDDIEGGATTFFLPDPRAQSGLLAHSAVRPQAGRALCFPQGNTANLIHEGSPVRSGYKYVIRSDVLYVDAEKADKR
jgi:hypothetical protein